jgi:transposase
MPWTETTRRQHDRSGQRYVSDCTDEEWQIIAPFLARTSKLGRPPMHDKRVIWDAIQFQAASGCQWRLLPKDFPPFTTVQHYFYRWRDNGLFTLINEVLVTINCLVEGRSETPTAAIINRVPRRGVGVGAEVNWLAGATAQSQAQASQLTSAAVIAGLW